MDPGADMSSRRRNGWKGCCAMCAANKGKIRGMAWKERRPASEIRKLGKRRGLSRKDLGDAIDPGDVIQ